MKKYLIWMIWTCQIIAMSLLLTGIVFQSTWYLLPVMAVWLGLFLASVKIPQNWIISTVLSFGCLIAGILSFTDYAVLWLLLAVAAQLFTWDLLCLRLKFEQFYVVEGANLIIRAHLNRLGIIGLLSLAAAAASLTITVRIEFGWLLLVGIIALAGLSLLFRNLHPGDRKI